MGIMVYSLLWVMQDSDHQPYVTYGKPVVLNQKGLQHTFSHKQDPQKPSKSKRLAGRLQKIRF